MSQIDYWTERFDKHLLDAKKMGEVRTALEAQVKALRANPADVEDLIFSGYLSAKMEMAHDYAMSHLAAAEAALSKRAEELGVEL